MEDSIFGELNLPSIPGIKSSCEAELLKLIAEIDLVISKKHQMWKKELEAVKTSLNSQKEENEYLKAALKASQKEVEELRHHTKILETSQADLRRKYEKELSDLREEVTKFNSSRPVQEQISRDDIYSMYKPSHNKEEFQIRKTGSPNKEAVVNNSKYETTNKDDLNRQADLNHERFIKVIKNLEHSLLEKDRLLKEAQKNEEHLTNEIEILRKSRNPRIMIDQSTVDRLINDATETVWRQEAEYREHLRKSITNDIDKLEERLKLSSLQI